MKYKVSVIVPVYNVGKYIGRCVDTLMSQTLKEIEYIFVDDCAQDRSYGVLVESLSKYTDRANDVRIVRHQNNKGVSQSRNDGLELATGEFITFCDADDWMDNRMYEMMFEKAVSESAEMVFCSFFMAYSDCCLPVKSRIDFSSDKISQMKSCMSETCNALWRTLVSRDVFVRSGYKFPADICFTEDFHLMLRLLHESKKTCGIEDPLYYYNQTNESSIVRNINHQKQIEEINCYGQIETWLKEKGIERLFRKELGWRYLKSRSGFVTYNLFDEFRSMHTSSNKYLLSVPSLFCPLKTKFKILLTMLHLDFICRWDNHRHGRY